VEDEECRAGGKSFQTRGPETAKLRDPYILVLVLGTITSPHAASSSSRMRVMNHNWSAAKQCLHPQSIAEINRHSVLSGDRIQQCETFSGSHLKDTDQCL